MDHNAFLSALKAGSLKTAYLFHGEEEFVKDRALERLLGTLDPAMREINVQDAPAQDAAAIRAACEALPFFADRRIVLVRDLPKEGEGKKVTAYLPDIPDTTVLVFFLRGDASKTNGVYKALDKLGAVVEFAPLSEAEAAKWAVAAARKKNVILEPPVARHLVTLAGTSMAAVSNELNKAADFVGYGGTVTREVLNSCVTRNIEYEIFEMLRYFLAGNSGDGLRALDSMLRNGENAISIASFLAGRFRLMLLGKQLTEAGMRKDAAIAKMGGNKKAAEIALENGRKFSLEALSQATQDFMEVGYLQVSGQIDARRALELALLKHMPRRR
ncbi:MAG: DNA polymerase III subunit delta [Clostridia bacterium]|nr:DNA polymerase III subunit delta [Clostridia bacterium]